MMKLNETQKRILMYDAVLFVNMMLMKYLWNNSLSKHITVLKPINSISEAALLAFALSVIKMC
jgi:hypothetical protein